MIDNTKLEQAMMTESFKKEVKTVTTAAELKELFHKYDVELTEEEVVDFCGNIAKQMEAGENGELSEDALENIAGGFWGAVIGVGVLVIGCVGLGIYNGYQEEKRKK